MTRPSARHEEDGVDAQVVAGAHETRRQAFRGDGYSPQAVLIERHGRALFAGTRLDLDEGEDAATTSDQIHFAARHPRTLGENAPAVQAQPPGGQPFGLAAALLGKLAAVQRLSSKARA